MYICVPIGGQDARAGVPNPETGHVSARIPMNIINSAPAEYFLGTSMSHYLVLIRIEGTTGKRRRAGAGNGTCTVTSSNQSTTN